MGCGTEVRPGQYIFFPSLGVGDIYNAADDFEGYEGQ